MRTVSWWSGNYEDENCTAPPFQFWTSGQRERENYGLNKEEQIQLENIKDETQYEEFLYKFSKDDCSICACIDAESEEDIWIVVAKHFPDYQPRFCELKDNNYNPSMSGRFQGFENKTSLKF